MTRRGGRAAGVAVVVLTAACLADAGEDTQYAGLGPRYEARAWLAANANPAPLASNRFVSPMAAAAFVDSLYTLGADTVYVLNVRQDSAWLAREGGPYADALLIRLPDTGTARRTLLEIGARELAREGFPRERERGQAYLYLWWD